MGLHLNLDKGVIDKAQKKEYVRSPYPLVIFIAVNIYAIPCQTSLQLEYGDYSVYIGGFSTRLRVMDIFASKTISPLSPALIFLRFLTPSLFYFQLLSGLYNRLILGEARIFPAPAQL
jgi:hypothetical protein